jgi:hypothetical protein
MTASQSLAGVQSAPLKFKPTDSMVLPSISAGPFPAHLRQTAKILLRVKY